MTLKRTVDKGGVVRLAGWCPTAKKRLSVVCGLDGDAPTAAREGQVWSEYMTRNRIVQPERRQFVPLTVEQMIGETGIKSVLRRFLVEHYRHQPVMLAEPAWLDAFAAWAQERAMTRQAFAVHHRKFMVACKRMAAEAAMPVGTYQRLELWEIPGDGWAAPVRQDRYTPPLHEVHRIVEATGEPLRSFLAVLACSGMRRADAVRIRGDWVQPVEPGLVRVTLREHKTVERTGSRTVMVWGRGAEVLSRLSLASPRDVVWPHQTMSGPLGQGRPSTELWSKSRIDYQIKRLCEQFGVRPFTTHGIRRAVARSIRDKHGLETARIIMGHSSAVVTAAHYAEHDTQRAVAAARDAV